MPVYLSEVYRNSLARQVRALGYEIENQRNVQGRDAGFEIRGVSAEVPAKFSPRGQQRDRAIEAFIAERGRWFVRLNMDERVWDDVFTNNRQRFFSGRSPWKFL